MRLISVRLPEELVAELDAMGGRSSAIRSACEAWVSGSRVTGGGERVRLYRDQVRVLRSLGLSADGLALRDAISSRGRHWRSLVVELGWTDMRFERAAKELCDAGLAGYREGVLELVE